MLGVQKSAVAKYENGRIVNIKRSTLKKISDILGLRPAELIFDAELQSNPVETAERHVEMIMDADLNEIYDYLKLMDDSKRKIAKGLIKSLAETETEA